jgi:hypothetical protein
MGRSPKNASQISKDIFGANLPAFDRMLALNETYAHLQELEEELLIQKQIKGGIFLYTSNWGKKTGKRGA